MIRLVVALKNNFSILQSTVNPLIICLDIYHLSVRVRVFFPFLIEMLSEFSSFKLHLSRHGLRMVDDDGQMTKNLDSYGVKIIRNEAD